MDLAMDSTSRFCGHCHVNNINVTEMTARVTTIGVMVSFVGGPFIRVRVKAG